MTTRLVAFDLDGTLVDSRQDLADSANALIVELGGAALPASAVVSFVGDGAAMLVQRALGAAGIAFASEHVARFLALYDERLLAHTTLYAGVESLLEAAAGVGRVAVLTNKPASPSHRILTGLGIRDRIEFLVGGDGPHPRKPDPSGLRALMAASGADGASTLLVGDSHVDRDTARAAGAAFCLVTYGFGHYEPSVAPREWAVDSAAAAEAVVRAFAEHS